MKKEIALALLGCSGILFLAAGCTPELAQIPVGQEEKNWDKVLKNNYYSFRPPHTPAPASYQPGIQAQKVESKELPEAIEDPAGIVDRAAENKGDVPPKAAVAEKTAEVKETPKAAAPANEKKAENTADKITAEYSKSYTVQSGDTLGKIALKNYGKASMADVILKANSKQLSDPKKLRPGMKLVLPEL